MKSVILFLIRLYRRFISPVLGKNCRFTPTCSAYFYNAVETYGAFLGVGLGLWRILRCNPFGRGGYDPLP